MQNFRLSSSKLSQYKLPTAPDTTFFIGNDVRLLRRLQTTALCSVKQNKMYLDCVVDVL